MRLDLLAAIGLTPALASAVAAQESAAPPTAPDQRAETHSRRGVELYAQGKLPEAVREMLKAYEYAPEPGLLYNIARIYQKMGEPQLALDFFSRFVKEPTADPDRVQKALGHMTTLRQELEISTTPTGVDKNKTPDPSPEPQPTARQPPKSHPRTGHDRGAAPPPDRCARATSARPFE